jgi:hypothetical protein
VAIFAYAIDHVEPKTEIQVEQVQRVLDGPQASSGEDTNLEMNQGKPRCIYQPSPSFIYLYTIFFILDCALGHRSCIEALVA